MRAIIYRAVKVDLHESAGRWYWQYNLSGLPDATEQGEARTRGRAIEAAVESIDRALEQWQLEQAQSEQGA